MAKIRFLSFICCYFLFCSVVLSEDWPQWLGEERLPVWNETGIIDKFPDGGPKFRWAAKLGGGYSGPAVADGRVLVMDRVDTSGDLVSGDLLHEGAPPQNQNFLRRKLEGKERVVCLRESGWGSHMDAYIRLSLHDGSPLRDWPSVHTNDRWRTCVLSGRGR